MKAFLSFLILFMATTVSANAQTYVINDYMPLPTSGSSVAEIAKRNVVRCGTNLQAKAYAYQEDGIWHGIDADFCRVIAQAVTGNKDNFELRHIEAVDVLRALNSGQIDVMLSGSSYTAKMETAKKALGVGPLYYDRQYIMVRNDEAEDLSEYKDKKICVSTDSDYQTQFDEFNAKHNFGIKYLTFDSAKKAQSAFLLKRCQLLTANSLVLKGLKIAQPKLDAHVLPLKISVQPMYAVVKYDNYDLQIALKWIFNALFLAEQYNIKQQNLSFFATNDIQELRNLLGDDPQMWQGLLLQPNWVREIIGAMGNYGDIYERNIGYESEFKLPRDKGKLMRDGGTILPLPFI